MSASCSPGALRAFVERQWPILSVGLIVTAIFVLSCVPALAFAYESTVLLLIRIIIVVGIYVFMGNTGIASLSHVGFMAIAAYASAWQTCNPALKKLMMHGLPDFLLNADVHPLLAAFNASCLAAIVALVVGLVIMRLQGIASSIATFSLLFIIYVVYGNWNSVTLGPRAVVGIPAYVDNVVAYTGTLLALVAGYLYQQSRWGLLARAVRDDEQAAMGAGIDVVWQRTIAYVISALLSGFGGVLYVHHIGTMQIDMFFIDLTFLLLAMLVVGGQSLAGAVTGVVFVTLVSDTLKIMERDAYGQGHGLLPSGFAEIVLGALVLVVLVYLPKGLTGGREFGLRSQGA